MPSTLTAVVVSGSWSGSRHGRQRALVEHDLDASHRGVDALVRAEVAFDDLDLAGEVDEVRPVPGREVVEHPHAVAPVEQRADEIRADEPGATGDERGSCHGADDIRRARSSTLLTEWGVSRNVRPELIVTGHPHSISIAVVRRLTTMRSRLPL